MSVTIPELWHDATGEQLDLGLPGGVLWTADQAFGSVEAVTVMAPPRDTQVFGYTNLHGEFQQLFGARGRPIIWQGHTRCTLAAIQNMLMQRDRLMQLEGTFTFYDDLDGVYADCRIDQLELGPKRAIQHVSFLYYLPYRVVLVQMEL